MTRNRRQAASIALYLALVTCPPLSTAAAITEANFQISASAVESTGFEVLVDEYAITSKPEFEIDQLPRLDIELLRVQRRLVPVGESHIVTPHPYWDWVIGNGYSSVDGDWHNLAISLQEKDANCLHNGLLRFPARWDSGKPATAILEIYGETCQYLKFRMRSTYSLELTPGGSNYSITAAAFNAQQAARLPRASLEDLGKRYPGLPGRAFTGGSRVATDDVTTSGVVIEGIHYNTGCHGQNSGQALCADVALPSYSLAKSLVAGLSLMALEKRYPGARSALVTDLVPECRHSGRWRGVNLGHLLNMVTGNFDSTVHEVDERSVGMVQGFFLASTHDEKLEFSCDHWPRRAEPDTTWVYHTSDTYLLGTAMNRLLRHHEGPEADFFEQVIQPLWAPLHLSAYTDYTLRTRDAAAQPFTGYGLTVTADDLARLGLALARGEFRNQLDEDMYDQALYPATARPEYGPDRSTGYRHGFWSIDAGPWLGCDKYTPFVFLSGYGGINLAIFPGEIVYYMVSDGGDFNLEEPARAAHSLKPFCTG